MKIESVTIKNLRCIKSCHIRLDDYTCLVGSNGAGKSTLLFALNVFFREAENAPTNTSVLTAADFHLGDTDTPIEITVTFTDLSKEALDDFKHYARHGKLVISSVATFNPNSGTAEVKQWGERLVMPDFAEFFKAFDDKEGADALKKMFQALESKFPELAALRSSKTKDGMYATLRSFEESKPELCKLERSEDRFYGITKGANLLQKYVQWVFIPAVKDATDEQSERKDGALGKLLARTVRAKVDFSTDLDTLLQEARRKYQAMLDTQQVALAGC
jgi:putative ATP-dependent endonuclease of OLD family